MTNTTDTRDLIHIKIYNRYNTTHQVYGGNNTIDMRVKTHIRLPINQTQGN